MAEQMNPMAAKRIVMKADRAASLQVTRDIQVPIGDGAAASIDVYHAAREQRGSAVVIVSGYRDAGFQSFLGCRFKETGWTVSWAELLAAASFTVITYSAPLPMDVHKLLSRLRAGDVGAVDGNRIGILATSGNGPTALSLLRGEAGVRCAALLYAYTLDGAGASAVAEAAKQFGFSNPGGTAADLRDDVPLFIARAGRDETLRLNEALDAFVAAALSRNMPITVVNHASAPHAFDLSDDSQATRSVIRQVIAFFEAQLGE